MKSPLLDLGRLVLNLFAFLLMVGVLLDGLIADWTINPVHDILFAKIGGPLFTTAHAFSILAVAIAGLVVAARTKSLLKGTGVTFGTAAIHELMLVPLAYVFQKDPGIHVFQPGFFFFDYGAYLLIALGASLVAFPELRSRFALFFVLISAYYLVTFIGAYGLNLPWFQPTINSATGPTPYFLAWPNNLQEIFGWALGAAVWLVPASSLTKWDAFLLGASRGKLLWGKRP